MSRDAFQSTARAIEVGNEIRPRAVGAAAAVEERVTAFKPAFGTEKIAIDPVSRSINSDFETMRSVARDLSDAGKVLDDAADFVPSSIGGTVENRAQRHWAGYAQGVEATDDNYYKYFYGQEPGIAPGIRGRVGSEIARIAGSLGDRLTARQFREAIGRALDNGDQSEIAEVAKSAAAWRQNVLEPFRQMLVKHGLLKEEDEVLGSQSYFPRDYQRDLIMAERDQFEKILSKNFEEKEGARFNEALSKFREQIAKKDQSIKDLELKGDERANELARVQRQLLDLDARNEAALDRADKISDLTTLARAGDRSAKDAIKQLTKEGGEEFAGYRAQRSKLRQRLRDLNTGVEAREEQAAKLLDRIDQNEARNTRALMKLIQKGQAVERAMDRLDDKALDEAIDDLKDAFAEQARIFDKAEERLGKMADDPELTDQVVTIVEAQEKRTARMTRLSERLGQAEGFDRAAARQAIADAVQELVDEVERANYARVLREERMRANLAKIDPAKVTERVQKLRQTTKEDATEFAAKWREKAPEVDIETGFADFKALADDLAFQITERILKSPDGRLPDFDIVAGARGNELARVLDIENFKIDRYLNRDVEQVMKNYVRTLGPDMEILDKFKDDVNLSTTREKLRLEYEDKLKAVPEGPEGQKERLSIQNGYRAAVDDLNTMLDRLRHVHGLPADPGSLGHRLFNTLRAVNYVRLMGGVVISSIPDPGNAVGRYGLTTAFRDGFAPLVTNLQAFRMNARQVRLAGAGLDLLTDQRTQALGDLMTDFSQRTRFERGIEWTSNRMGFVSLMAPWNAFWKQYVGVLTIAELLRGAKLVSEGKVSTRTAELLAQNGINEDLAKRMWAQFNEPGGGGELNGVLLPNTEAWKDKEALAAFQTAIVREANNAIVTPGLERPSIMTKNDFTKTLFQFQSFGMSSVQKIMIARLQQRDAAALNGAVLSMGLGALSYYLQSMTTGGQAEERMRKANTAKWATEAVDRSGLLGVLSSVNRLAEKTPLRGMSRLTGEPPARLQPGDFLTQAVGPTGDLLVNAARVTGAVGTLDPIQADVRALRRSLPYQNLFYLRRLFDQVEQGSIEHFGVPKSRREN